jgi:signal transduction histidine kinase
MLNGLVFGHVVRCGVALPAAFLVAYALGAHGTNGASALGLGLLGVNIVSQGIFDPNLGPSMIPILVPLAVGFFAAGRLVLSRARASAALREQSGALRRQREETARMSVLADRARISGDLTESLDNRIAKIQALAASAQGTEATDPRAASDALAAIEDDSRQLMESMRRIVGDLDAAPTDAPSLQELSSLLARATSAQATLTVEGDSRRLPAGIELAAYRIVEHLLLGLEDDSGARIELSVSCRADSVEIHLSGPPALGVEFPALLAAARERAALYLGTLEGLTVGRVREATVRLPLVSGYA